jgi:hypothetical protein
MYCGVGDAGEKGVGMKFRSRYFFTNTVDKKSALSTRWGGDDGEGVWWWEEYQKA